MNPEVTIPLLCADPVPDGEAAVATLESAAAEFDFAQKHFAILNSWVRGNTVYEIAAANSMSQSTIVSILREGRAKLADIQKDSLINNAAERIAALRQLIKETWAVFDSSEKTNLKALALIHNVEQTIAKLQGLLNERSSAQAAAKVEIKLYDFDDRFPKTIEASVASSGDRSSSIPLSPVSGVAGGD